MLFVTKKETFYAPAMSFAASPGMLNPQETLRSDDDGTIHPCLIETMIDFEL